MARGQSSQGSSYEILANEVPQASPPLNVPDPGCGSGYLLELSGSLEQVAAFFGGSCNVFAPGERREAFMRRLRTRLEPLQEADGQIPYALTILILRCRRV